MSSWTVQLSAVKGDSTSGSYAGSSGGSSHGGIIPQSLISINRNNNSNYMNITNDDLFPGEMMESSHMTTDDMALSYGQQKLGMVEMMSDRNSHSLPNGLPPGSVAKYNTQSPTSQQFLVEHLASFPQDVKSGYLTPAEALTKLKKISSGRGLWAQKMNMNISINRLVMANGETMEMIEEYPLEQISLCITVLDDPMFEQLLIFNTKLSKDKVGAVHLFQCKADEANVISEVINKSREQKASKYMNGHANGSNGVSEGSHSHSSSDVEVMPRETRTQLNLQQKHAVARAVEAFQTTQLQPKLDGHPTNEVNGNITPIQDAKISRDVEILNRCIEEIENFVVMLKRINEARKELQTKRKSKKKKTESILILQSQPPPDHRIYDIYQKFKHSLNLLAKLRPHVNEPNAPELIHYLFIPLGIIVKVTRIDKAQAVVYPLLTLTCVDLLVNCLDSREYHFWQSLGPNWTLTKSAEQFKDRYFQPYMPIFADGWVPPEIVANEKQEAVARSTAAMVARMKGRKISAEVMNANPTVLLAAMKFKSLGEKAQRQGFQRSNSSSGILHTSNTASVHPPQRSNSFDRVGKRLVGTVVYDYMAHNNKELTIHAGEKVNIIDNSRRWWLVQNYHGGQGYVPSTVLEIPTSESGMSSPRDSVDHISPNESPREIKLAQSLDSNQNYVNGTSWPSNLQTTLPQPVHTITPVLISVQLLDGSQVQTNANGTHIIASPAGMKPTTSQATGIQIGVHPSNVQQNAIHRQSSTSPPLMFQTGVQGNGTNIQQSGIRQTGQISPTYTVVNKIKSTNDQSSIEKTKIISQNRTLPPDTAAVPPPPPPPTVSPKPYSVLVSKEANFQVQSAPSQHLSTNESKGDIHNELKNRLSLVQPKQHQVEETMSSIDAVDVFIPLYKSSTADDVSRWLFKLGCSERTIDILKGKTAHDLFNINKERMIDLIGHDEGLQLHEELLVQNGAENRHKTLTEFQKALVKRVQKREEQQEIARDDFSKKFQDQASFIKKQKGELERHKNEARNPASATFTSFSSSSIDVGTPQRKTKL